VTIVIFTNTKNQILNICIIEEEKV